MVSDEGSIAIRSFSDSSSFTIIAHFRLGAMQQSKGDLNEAIDHYKQVFETDENDAKAWIMIGQAQSENNDRTCKRSFEKVLKSCDKDDLYTHVALGNFHASAAREMKTDKQSSQVSRETREGIRFIAVLTVGSLSL
jgi:RNA polymerase-associated protein CTR9